jgi:Tfp pilus assembly protein PilW
MSSVGNWNKRLGDTGFTIVELILACVIFPIIVVGISTSFIALRHAYMTARQLNEVYTVLSACPELDRALEFSSLSGSTNCYPNNSFEVEDANRIGNTVYSPTLTVVDTSSLSSGDPLKTIPDSKVVNVQVKLPQATTAEKPYQLRILITRNGIGQQ